MDIVKNRIRIKTKYISGLKGSSSGYNILCLYYKNLKKGLFQPKWLLKTFKKTDTIPKDKSFNNLHNWLINNKN